MVSLNQPIINVYDISSEILGQWCNRMSGANGNVTSTPYEGINLLYY